MTLATCRKIAPALGVGLILTGVGLPASQAAPPDTGQLKINVTGLPKGVEAKIRVTGPRNYSRKVQGDIRLRNLRPGRYTVTSTQVSSDSSTYQPQKGTLKTRLQSGKAVALGVNYKIWIGPPPLPPIPAPSPE